MNSTDLARAAGSLAQSYARQRGVQVSVKTNVAPEFKVWDAKQSGGGILNALGFRGIVIARDENGEILFQSGATPQTNYVLAGALAVGLAFAGYLIVRGWQR